jgi:hypothetical protein
MSLVASSSSSGEWENQGGLKMSLRVPGID